MLVVDKFYILQYSWRTKFSDNSDKQTIRYFYIISDAQELICMLQK